MQIRIIIPAARIGAHGSSSLTGRRFCSRASRLPLGQSVRSFGSRKGIRTDWCLGTRFASSASANKHDLANTPAERAAAAAKAAAQFDLTEEDKLFRQARTVTIGGGETPEVVVVGAGLVGALAAIVMRRKGFKVTLFERYPDMRSIPFAGRSINLSVTSRGLRAVKSLGGNLHDELIKLTTPIMGRIIHMPDGERTFQRYGKDDTEHNYSVSRVELNKLLINMASKEGVEFHFNQALSDTSDFASDGLVGSHLHFYEGSPADRKRVHVHAKCPVIACDGAGSRIRYALRRQGLTEFTEDLIDFGYKEVQFPYPGEGNDFGAKGENGGEPCDGGLGLHIWPRGDHFLMALANLDGSFTGTIYQKHEGAGSFKELQSKDKVTEFCEQFYSHAVPHVGGIEKFTSQLIENPVGLLGTVSCTKWAVQGKVLLIGDSCHAMVPFFGQGCNSGFEDTLWLSRTIDKHLGSAEGKHIDPAKCTGENFAAVFEEVEQLRRPNADAICAMALENFVEMRVKTGDRKFQAMKHVENRIELAMPEKFRSRYAMVCYGGAGNVSYDNAKKLGILQDSILERLCAGMGDLSTEELLKAEVASVDLSYAEKLIDAELIPEQKSLGIDLSTVRH